MTPSAAPCAAPRSTASPPPSAEPPSSPHLPPTERRRPPLSSILGDAYVRVRPDTTGFGSTLNSGIASSLTKVAGLVTGVLAGIGVAAAAKSILAIGTTYQDTMNNLQAVSGATAAQMALVGERAKQLGADTSLTATSAADAAIAMTELAKGGLSVDAAMQAAQGTLQLAAAAGISAGEAATIQSAALNAFNLEADQAGRVSDVLANAANAAAGEIGDFALGLSQASAVAAATGISLEDTAATLGILANNGIAGSDAGTLLKSALLALQSPSGPAAKAMEELGLQAYNASGEFVGLSSIFGQLSEAQKGMTEEQYAAATSTLFGSDAARLAGIAAREGSEGFDEMAEAMSRGGAAAEVAAAKAKGVTGAWEAFKSQIETVQINIFEAVAPAIESTLRRIGTAFDTLTDEVPHLWDALSAGDPQRIAESLDKLLGGTGENVDDIREAIEFAIPIWDALVASGANLVDVARDLGPILGDVLVGGLKLAAGALRIAAPLLEILTGFLATTADALGKLPGPLQAVVVGLIALKVATSADLLGRLSGRGGLSGAIGRVGTAAVDAGRNIGSVGDRLRGLRDNVALQRTLMEQTTRSTANAAGSYGSMADRLAHLTSAGSGATTQLSRAQEMMRGYDRALGDAVRSSTPAITAVHGIRDGYRQAADAHATMVARLTNGGTDRVASSLAGINGAFRTLGRDGLAAAASGVTNLRVAAGSAATSGIGALRSAGGSLAGFLGGPWGIALAGGALAVGLITSSMQKSKQEVQDWATALNEGGIAARDAMAAAREDDKTGVWEGLGNLLTSDTWNNEDVEGWTSAVDEARQTARDLYDSLSPVAQAQQDVTRETNDLSLALETYGQGSPQVIEASGNLAFAQNKLETAQQDVATASLNVADALQLAAAAALAGTNADLGASMATTALSTAVAEYQTELAAGTMTALEATQASDEMSQQALQTANALAQQAYANSEATTETGKQAEADAALLASLKATAEQLGVNTPAAITDLIASLSNSATQASTTATEMSNLGISVLSIPDEHSVVIDAPTAEQQARLETLGYTVRTLPNGQVVVTADLSPAESAIAEFVNRQRTITLSTTTLGSAARAASNQATFRQTEALEAAGRRDGGPISGPGGPRSDSILGLDRYTGTPTAWVSNREFVTNAAAYAANKPLVEAINAGLVPPGTDPNVLALLADGGPVFGPASVNVGVDTSGAVPGIAAALAAASEAASVSAAGPAGSGAVGGGWQSLWNLVKAAIPSARINSTYRAGDPGYHGRGKAIDFGFGSGPGGAGSAGLASIAAYLYTRLGRSLAELIYDGIGDNTPDVKNGRDHRYPSGTQRDHQNHVHAAVYDSGGVLESGTSGVNLSGKPEAVFTNDQWRLIAALVEAGGSSGGDTHIHLTPSSGETTRDQMEEAMFQLRRLRRGGKAAAR